MAYGAFAETKSRYRDLEALVDYREYECEWTAWFSRDSRRWDIRTSGSSVERRSSMTGAFGSAFASWQCPGVPARNSSCTGEEAVLDGFDAVNPTIQMKENSRCT